jgi:hypothetical protein
MFPTILNVVFSTAIYQLDGFSFTKLYVYPKHMLHSETFIY